MNRTKRVVAIGVLCVGTSALSFGDIFQTISPNDWTTTYTSDTALFSAVIQQGGYSVQSGFPGAGDVTQGTGLTSDASTPFTLTYDPTTPTATISLQIGGDAAVTIPALTIAPAGGGLDHIGIALSTGEKDETITLTDLMLNNVSNGDDLTTSGQGLFDFAMTPPTDLTAVKSTLTGDINISWTTADPNADPQLSAEIVGADKVTPAAPEPGTWALLGSALAGLGLLRRKRIV